MLGLGGGIIVIPALTLLFHIDIRYAIGASIVAVIATSSGAAALTFAMVSRTCASPWFWNSPQRLALLTGAYLAGLLNTRWLYIIFGIVMGYSAIVMYRKRHNGDLETAYQARPVGRLFAAAQQLFRQSARRASRLPRR